MALDDIVDAKVYAEPLKTFKTNAKPAPVRKIPIMKEGRKALEKINEVMSQGNPFVCEF